MLMDVLIQHVNSHTTNGQSWPNDAEYCIVYRYRTWPVGYDREWSTEFFTNSAEVEAWEKKQREWTKLEDNGIQYSVYEWDLGPHFVRDKSLF